MLDLKEYKRAELIAIYKTDSLQAIKRRVTREGYTFTETGRGATYTMTITKRPKELKLYCIEVLGFEPQTNFDLLYPFLDNVLNNEEFINLQFNEMCEVLTAQGHYISVKTISKYYEQLKSKEWFYSTHFDYVYSVYDGATQHNKYITKEEYNELYKLYFKTIADYITEHSKELDKFDNPIEREEEEERIRRRALFAADKAIKARYGYRPKKRAMNCKSAFYIPQYNKVAELLEEEYKNNDN